MVFRSADRSTRDDVMTSYTTMRVESVISPLLPCALCAFVWDNSSFVGGLLMHNKPHRTPTCRLEGSGQGAHLITPMTQGAHRLRVRTPRATVVPDSMWISVGRSNSEQEGLCMWSSQLRISLLVAERAWDFNGRKVHRKFVSRFVDS